jgi:hypothetical protein
MACGRDTLVGHSDSERWGAAIIMRKISSSFRGGENWEERINEVWGDKGTGMVWKGGPTYGRPCFWRAPQVSKRKQILYYTAAIGWDMVRSSSTWSGVLVSPDQVWERRPKLAHFRPVQTGTGTMLHTLLYGQHWLKYGRFHANKLLQSRIYNHLN